MRLRRRQRDRGATVVEYALGIALLCVASIGAIQFFQDGAEERYDERAGQANPGESYGNLGPSDGGGSTGGTTDGTTDGTGVGVTAVVVGNPTGTSQASGNEWAMAVTVTVLGDGQPLEGVTITAPTWNPAGGNTATCTTNSAGQCTWTHPTLARTGNGAVGSAIFTLGSVTYTNPDNTSPTITLGSTTTVTCQAPQTGNGTGTCA